MDGILGSLGIDPFYIFLVLFIMQIILIVLLVLLGDKYKRLQKSYSVFMRGKNGKSIEKTIFKKFEELEEISDQVKINEKEIEDLRKKMERHYQKAGIVKYDAFHEMGGNLSFALTMLDENDNGWILNAMHSREGCYTYIKEIVRGESYIELSEEEKQCLEKTIYQEEKKVLDIKFLRTNPEVVKQNIRNKFQDEKLPLVDEVIELDKRNREIKQEVEALRAEKNKASKQIGAMMAQKKLDEAEALKKKVAESAGRIDELSVEEKDVEEKIRKIMMTIPNIIDPSVPIGKDDSENVELERFGDPVVPDFEIPYHTEIMESFNGIDLDSARKVAGNGFYYLMGDIARLHSAVIAYARDFMINRGFTYCVPPFMIRSNVVTGVMSFAEMDAMMYKIEGEDLYLIGTSEHSMIGKFINTQLTEDQLPQTLTSYSPCFRKEKGAHGIEERGVYRIHQFEKQEMIVVCKPEESMGWYDKLWKNTVDLFRSMDIPVRTLECCSGDLADLKVKSVDVEAWSPRQKKYFEVGSCSNLGDAQARRLGIRVKGENGSYFAHTLNNTVVAPPRMLIAFLENNLQEDGSVRIPEVLRPYMGGNDKIVPKK